jgi:hypothetical protein
MTDLAAWLLGLVLLPLADRFRPPYRVRPMYPYRLPYRRPVHGQRGRTPGSSGWGWVTTANGTHSSTCTRPISGSAIWLLRRSSMVSSVQAADRKALGTTREPSPRSRKSPSSGSAPLNAGPAGLPSCSRGRRRTCPGPPHRRRHLPGGLFSAFCRSVVR